MLSITIQLSRFFFSRSPCQSSGLNSNNLAPVCQGFLEAKNRCLFYQTSALSDRRAFALVSDKTSYSVISDLPVFERDRLLDVTLQLYAIRPICQGKSIHVCRKDLYVLGVPLTHIVTHWVLLRSHQHTELRPMPGDRPGGGQPQGILSVAFEHHRVLLIPAPMLAQCGAWLRSRSRRVPTTPHRIPAPPARSLPDPRPRRTIYPSTSF